MSSTMVYSTPQQLHRHSSFSGDYSDPPVKKSWRMMDRSKTISDESGAGTIPAAVCSSNITPLERFSVAKSKVSKLFENVESLLQESGEDLLRLASKDEGLADSDDLRRLRSELETERSRMRNIAEKVRSNQMKVAFFGRTSNGKSSTINALLRDRVLPSGIGHTTSCFCCVQGTNEEKGFLELPGSHDRKSIESVQQLAHAVHNDKLESNSAVQVFWPRDRCPLLKNDVVLVDSPGTDISPDLDTCIGEHCTDADVFVLVANAESTLMQTEKNFFHKVAQMSSRPNIFILNNRWDASACEEEELMAEVREQHLTFNMNFLVDELKVVDRREAQKRIFFVSAREALQLRMQASGRSSGAVLAEGHGERRKEFDQFERTLEECLSSHAIRTKFGEPARAGMHVAEQLKDSIGNFRQHVEKLRVGCEEMCRDARENSIKVRRVGKERIAQWSRRIEEMRQRARDQVADAMSDEIHRLWNTVNDYQSSLGFDEVNLEAYEKELCAHVSAGMGEHLVANCANELSTNCVQVQEDMLTELERLIPATVPPPTNTTIVRPHFRISDDVDIMELCSDFRADLRFRFRWRLTTMFRWLTGGHGTSGGQGFSLSRVPDMMKASASAHDMHGSDASKSSTDGDGSDSAAEVIQKLEFGMQLASATFVQAPWLLMGVGALLWKAVGTKVIVGGVCVYGALYGYERLCWTTRAKERTYKEQLVEHVTGKLQVMVGFMSNSSSHQVEKHLELFKDHLDDELTKAQTCLDEQQAGLRSRIDQLQQLENNAKRSVNTAGFATSGFHKFLSGMEQLEEGPINSTNLFSPVTSVDKNT